ncbi:MAG TPA: PAS domain-containing protein, partial [Deltaproteobacteria bacterium]|nr:PAS domain-containing protein [Deltaproteobacteria bacterium]
MPDLASWRSLLTRISAYYQAADEDRYTLERSLEISSRELMALHDEVAAERTQLQTILASLPQGIIVVDSDQRVILTNPAAQRLLGHTPRPGDALRDHLRPASEDGQPTSWAGSPRELIHLVPEAEPVPVQLDQVTLGEDRTLLTLTDMSERIRHQHDLELARVEAEVARRAEQARAAFLARMSHELRTPLNAILGYTEILDEEVSNTQSRSDLARIHASGSHLLGLINDVLDLSKVDAGRMEARPVPTDLDHLIAD